MGGALGAAGVACLLFLAPASSAATPAPDPPPVTVTPDAKPTAPVQRAPTVRRTAVAPPTVVTRTVVTPVIVTREVPARPAATPAQRRPAKPKAAVKPKPAAAAKAKPEQAVAPALPPHDRSRVPLARFVPTAEELNRSLVAVAGGGLGFVALGGAVVLLAARRQFGGLAR